MTSTAYKINLQNGLLNCGIRKPDLLVKDAEDSERKSLKFHIEADDYFGTLATILELLREESHLTAEVQDSLWGKIIDDQIYLQQNYKIVKKRSEKK
jgi:hypothetical protein